MSEKYQRGEAENPKPEGDGIERQHLQFFETIFDRIKQAHHPADNEAQTDTKRTPRPFQRFAKRNRHVVALVATIVGGGLLAANYYLVQATNKTVEIAQETLAADRAWLVIEQDELFPGGIIVNSDGDVLFFAAVYFARWKNAGRSPAINVDLNIEYKMVPVDEGAIPYFDNESIDTPRLGIIGPGITVSTQEVSIVGIELEDFRLGKTKMIIHMRSEYRDIFKNNLIRYTDYVTEIVFIGLTEVTKKDGSASIGIHANNSILRADIGEYQRATANNELEPSPGK